MDNLFKVCTRYKGPDFSDVPQLEKTRLNNGGPVWRALHSHLEQNCYFTISISTPVPNLFCVHRGKLLFYLISSSYSLIRKGSSVNNSVYIADNINSIPLKQNTSNL